MAAGTGGHPGTPHRSPAGLPAGPVVIPATGMKPGGDAGGGRPSGATSASPGPRAGAPPVPPWAPLAWFAVLALVLAYVVVALVRPPGPLDQPDPASQRDGLLRDGPRVPPQVGDVAFGGRTVVLLFLREPPEPADVRAYAQGLPPAVELTVVLPFAADGSELPVPVAADPDGELAAAVELPTPVDGGRGIGYAVVDADRRVRYSTLDPAWRGNAFEVDTIAGAVT